MFWKTLKPLLSDKGINTTRISLINDNKMIAKDKSFKYLIYVFWNCSKHYEYNWKHFLTEVGNLEDPIKVSVNKFENHSSILSINENINLFHFQK